MSTTKFLKKYSTAMQGSKKRFITLQYEKKYLDKVFETATKFNVGDIVVVRWFYEDDWGRGGWLSSKAKITAKDEFNLCYGEVISSTAPDVSVGDFMSIHDELVLGAKTSFMGAIHDDVSYKAFLSKTTTVELDPEYVDALLSDQLDLYDPLRKEKALQAERREIKLYNKSIRIDVDSSTKSKHFINTRKVGDVFYIEYDHYIVQEVNTPDSPTKMTRLSCLKNGKKTVEVTFKDIQTYRYGVRTYKRVFSDQPKRLKKDKDGQ